MFKIGKLIARGGELSWKSFREEESYKTAGPGSQMDKASNYTSQSKAMVNSRFRKDLSVVTPSVAKSRALSHAS